MSEETRAKMREARKGFVWSEESKAKLAASALKIQKESRIRYCRTENGKQQMLAMAKAASDDPRVRQIRADKMRAQWQNPVFREKTMAARRAKAILRQGDRS